MLSITERRPPPRFALFELGFRPFFAGAGLFAVIVTTLWLLIYGLGTPLRLAGLPPVLWHAHEMIYGYAMAVIAGFLLTAVGNWTGVPGLRGLPLVGLFLLWLTGRAALYLPGSPALPVAAAADLLFMLGLIVAVSLPVIQVRQWTQLGIVSKLWLMLAGNALFYAGALGYLDAGLRWGAYTGLYLVLALVFVMARRVVPFFIARGVDEPATTRNPLWVDIASLALFAAWALLDVFTRQTQWVAWLSVALLALHLWRLYDWHTPGIWRKPLLWSLYLAYGFLTLGFALKAWAIWLGGSPYLAVHAFAAGGIGLMTVGMMSRVALGHTGRDVFHPPTALVPIFTLILAGAAVRVLLPLFDVLDYRLCIALAQALWILGFAGFSLVYIPQLLRPRVDGRPG